MSVLRERFVQYMRLRGFAEKTKESYLRAVVDLARAYRVSPDVLTNDQIQAHLDRLMRERHVAWATANVYFSAYRCFYRELLKRNTTEFGLPQRGRSRKRPTVLDRETVRRILGAAHNLKHRALLMTVYGSGLRVSEVCRLKPHHIESAPERMVVRVEQGKAKATRTATRSCHSAAWNCCVSTGGHTGRKSGSSSASTVPSLCASARRNRCTTRHATGPGYRTLMAFTGSLRVRPRN